MADVVYEGSSLLLAYRKRLRVNSTAGVNLQVQNIILFDYALFGLLLALLKLLIHRRLFLLLLIFSNRFNRLLRNLR